MQYRVAIKQDLEDLAKLHAESWHYAYRGIFTDAYLDNEVWTDRHQYWVDRMKSKNINQHVIVAIEGNRLYGFICAIGGKNEKWGTYIDNLHVSKDAQGKGVGKQLMHLIAKWTDENFQDTGIYLKVLENDIKARNFYQRLGAEHVDTSYAISPGDSGEQVTDLIYSWQTCGALILDHKNSI